MITVHAHGIAAPVSTFSDECYITLEQVGDTSEIRSTVIIIRSTESEEDEYHSDDDLIVGVFPISHYYAVNDVGLSGLKSAKKNKEY